MAINLISAKISIAGQGNVGKTTLIQRFITGKFNKDLGLTIGCDFYTKSIQLKNNKSIKLIIWDFSGEERFTFLFPMYLKGSSGIMLLFDSTEPSSLYNLHKWLEIIKNKKVKIPIILIATKCDLEQKIKVHKQEAEEFQNKNQLNEFIETSSKIGMNVEFSFYKIAELIDQNNFKFIKY